MKVYLAGSGWEHLWIKDNIFDIFRLESFMYLSENEKQYINKYKSFLLDSGAFTFMSKNKDKTNWNEYVEKYANFINKHNIDLFFELDIDNIVGLKEVENLRNKLEKLTNKQCIPVWHKSRGKEYWLKMISDYKYCAIGGIVTKEIKPNEYPFFNWFLSEAKKQNCKVHGLGFTNILKLITYPFYSVDSTSWLSGNRFGYIHLFDGKKINQIPRREGMRLKTKEVAKHNFTEWLKFQKYAETNL